MTTYRRKIEIFEGGPFRCYNCNKTLVRKIGGSDYILELDCPRCKSHIVVKMREKMPSLKLIESEVKKVGT